MPAIFGDTCRGRSLHVFTFQESAGGDKQRKIFNKVLEMVENESDNAAIALYKLMARQPRQNQRFLCNRCFSRAEKTRLKIDFTLRLKIADILS